MLLIHTEERLIKLLLPVFWVFLQVDNTTGRRIVERDSAVLCRAFLDQGSLWRFVIITDVMTDFPQLRFDLVVMHLGKQVVSARFTFRTPSAPR